MTTSAVRRNRAAVVGVRLFEDSHGFRVVWIAFGLEEGRSGGENDAAEEGSASTEA